MTIIAEGQTPTAEGQTNQDDIAKELERLKATNERLLEESKRYKERAQRLEAEQESKLEEQLSSEKDVNKILEAERKRIEKLAKENKEIKQKTLQANIRATVAKYATDVNDLDDLLNQPRFASILTSGIDKDSLFLDEDAAKEFVETVLKEKPYLRRSPEATTMMTKKPSYGQSGTQKPISQMTDKELEETLFSMYGKK